MALSTEPRPAEEPGAAGRWEHGRWVSRPSSSLAVRRETALERAPRDTGRPGVGAPTPRWEIGAYGGIFIVALLMRLWDLGTRAVHHDESLHGYYSWQILIGNGYDHNPLTHGMFLFHITAGTFFLFGDNDYTLRLSQALFGAALVVMPWFLRHRLGVAGALFTSAMLAFSPALLYFSRFARNDIYMAVFTLGLVIAIWRYIDERKNRYLYAIAALLALGFATKETQYITVAIFGVALAVLARHDLIRWLRGDRSVKTWGPAAVMTLIVGALVLPLAGPLLSVFQGPLGIVLVTHDGVPGVPTGIPQGGGIAVAVAISVFLIGVGLAAGLMWNRRVWLACWVIFALVYATLMTTVYTNPVGIASGIWQSLGYWLAQQDVARGGQPWYYFFILTAIYEFLPWTIAIGAAAWYAFRGDSFTRFLVFWAVATFGAYSIAGEKMPWLLVHVTLPLIVLSGRALGDVTQSIPWRRTIRNGGLVLLAGVPLFLVLLWRLLSFEVQAGSALSFAALWGLLTVLGFLLVGFYALARRVGPGPVFGGTLLVVVMLMGALTVRAAWIATYHHGDVPREMLVYTQSAPDIARVAREINAIAQLTGERDQMRITIDSADGFTWPWAWYLRNYQHVGYPDFATSPPAPDPLVTVAVVNARNNSVARPIYEDYHGGRRIVHRWWFREDGYRAVTWGTFFSTLFNRNEWRGSIDFFLYRKMDNPIGSVDSYLYVRDDVPMQPFQ